MLKRCLWEAALQKTLFGSYQLIELLGRGGMGEVWRAYDTVIDRVVALKILPADVSRDDVFQRRFRREAHAIARLNSPHVVPIHTHGEIDGRLFVDMRLIEGRDLQSVLEGGPLPPVQAVQAIEQVAKALDAAHKVGLLHRDVKPSNILIDDDGYAYLIDFGLAFVADERGLTTTGGVVGTFRYMAPERFKTEEIGALPIDARSDVYALACVLYECLTAKHAIGGYTLEQQISNHLVAPPPLPSDTNPGLPRGFDMVIAKGMAKRPADRYDTAVELARAAREAVTTPSSPASLPRVRKARNASAHSAEERVPNTNSVVLREPPARRAAGTLGRPPARYRAATARAGRAVAAAQSRHHLRRSPARRRRGSPYGSGRRQQGRFGRLPGDGAAVHRPPCSARGHRRWWRQCVRRRHSAQSGVGVARGLDGRKPCCPSKASAFRPV